MPAKKRTCVMCGDPLEGKATYTGALIFGNKSRDPHVGPYCKNCVPPAIAKTVECVEDCPLTDAKWIPVDGNCIITNPNRSPSERRAGNPSGLSSASSPWVSVRLDLATSPASTPID